MYDGVLAPQGGCTGGEKPHIAWAYLLGDWAVQASQERETSVLGYLSKSRTGDAERGLFSLLSIRFSPRRISTP
jgi:hypothetical protein